MDKQSIFRQKSIDRVSSPEQLNDYIRVANPGIWIVIAALILLLIGVCVWGVLGRLETTLDTVAIAEGGEVTVYIREADMASVKAGQELTVGGETFTLGELSEAPVAVDAATFSDYALHVGSLTPGEWVYTVTFAAEVADGVHAATVVTDSVSPMSFVLN